MSGPRLRRAFFARDTALVARELVGCVLEVAGAEGVVRGVLVETEAYVAGDSTSHARAGLTARNAAMFARPGTLYVYFTYGLHFCLNVATERAGVGVAVLLRAAALTAGHALAQRRRGPRVAPRELARGPGRLCQALGVDRAHDGLDACAAGSAVRFYAPSPEAPAGVVASGPRVGVRGSDDDVARALRFYAAGSPYVSRGPRP